MCAFFVCVRAYEQMFGLKAGMDSYAGEFQTYWMPVLYIFGTVELISFLALISYLWKTRDLDVANVQPREELRRIFYLLGWILVYGVAFYWGASYFSEQDAAWHQALVRDSAFTPVNIVKYYVADPIYIITGIGGVMYARTRLPTFACKGCRSLTFFCSSGRSCFCRARLSTNGAALSGSWRNCSLLRYIGDSCFLAGLPSRRSVCRF